MATASRVGGRYRVERVLGYGGMATVYLAWDEELDRPVGVKVLADNLSADDAFRTRFLREARAAARLNHANVVSVLDAGEDSGRPYIVMEYVEGETLADALRRRGRFSADEAVALALQACAGLAHAHAAGLVHRDVKPQNLLLRNDGTLKVADFGIVRAAEATQLTATGTVLGTAAYLAPEQATGSDVTEAADVYALGAVLYELLTGRTPYGSESVSDLVRKQAGEPVTAVRELAPDVPPGVEAVVTRALAPHPESRPSSAEELARALEAAGAERPTEPLVPPGAPTVPLRHRPRRHVVTRSRTAVAALVMATLLALAAAFVLISSERDDGAARAPTRVQPVPPAATPERQAENLAEWLRRYSSR